MPADSLMLFLLFLLPWAAGLAVALLPWRGAGGPRALALGATALALALLGGLSAGWSAAPPPALAADWLPAAGLEFALWLDGTALFWAWLVLGIGLLVLHYAGHYMDPADAPRRFYAALMLFMGAMLGVVLSRNFVLMFVFWELTSVTSFLLIGHWSHKKEAVAGARRALLLTAGGGLALLAGVALLGLMLRELAPGAPLHWDTLEAHAPALLEHRWSGAALVLMLVAAFTKSAQFPFHFWLPGAMQAPTPVSAYLHAATMVKAGIYLLGRLYPVFNGADLWLAVAVVGIGTMALGGLRATLSHDLKELLAWSTVSQLGLLTAYYGFGYRRLGGEELLALDLLLVASHALFKAGLFMACGVVDHATHTRDWRQLGGLGRRMPLSFALFAGGALSMAGLPFTLGFVAKKLFLEAGLTLDARQAWVEDALLAGAVLASAFTMAYCLRMVLLPFLGAPRSAAAEKAHEGGPGILAAPLLLIGLCVAGGLYVPLVQRPISWITDPAIFDTATKYTVGLFKKADGLFWLSLGIYLVGGPLLYALARRLDRAGFEVGRFSVLRRGFDAMTTTALVRGSDMVTGWSCPDRLGRALATILLATALLAGAGWWRIGGAAPPAGSLAAPPAAALLLAALAALAALLVVLLRETLARLLAMGLTGLLMIGMFVVFHAPDLAITLTLVELGVLLVLLLMLLALRRSGSLKVAPGRTGGAGRALRLAAVLAFAVLGGGVTWLAGSSAEARLTPGQSPAAFYLANAKSPTEPGGHSGGGRNVVNVILVDFRGYDTLGEIVALGAAALGALLLLGGRGGAGDRSALARPRQDPTDAPTPNHYEGRVPERGKALILRETAPAVALLCAVLATIFLFVGHNRPGGGFIGGLLAAVAFVPFYLAFLLRERFPLYVRRPEWLIAAGLALALATAAAPMAAGLPFLRTTHRYVTLPGVGSMELASAMFFDLGVFLLVWGAMLAVLDAFSREESA